MLFGKPVAFREALDSRAVRAILPTTADTLQLAQLEPEIRERAMFSARVTDYRFLDQANTLINRILAPEAAAPGEYMDSASARAELKDYLQSVGYSPEPGKEGTLQDLSSDSRLNLIIDTNEKMAHGYGNWMQGQSEAVLDQWPAQELFRAEGRKEERDWPARWSAAGGDFYDGGRMIALKNSPIWTAISAFELPYPPFDFNSGMDVRDVDRDEAEALGLIDRDSQLRPESRGFAEDLAIQLTPEERQSALFQALQDTLGEGAEIIEGTLRLKRRPT